MPLGRLKERHVQERFRTLRGAGDRATSGPARPEGNAGATDKIASFAGFGGVDFRAAAPR